jgi:hypothetical protein
VIEGGSEAPPAGGALENTANNYAPAGQRHDQQDKRSDRWDARGVLWRESSLARVRSCGRWPISPDGAVQLRYDGVRAGYAGLPSCGSVHACPVCNARIAGVRRMEFGVAFAVGLESGSAAFGGLTLSHHVGDGLAGLWRALSTCWAAVTQDKAVRTVRGRLGHVGVTRTVEVTYGANGWHPHVHPLHWFEGVVTDDQVDELHAVQTRAWFAAAARLGLSTPRQIGQELHLVSPDDVADQLGEYVTKTYTGASSAAWELTSTQTKTGAGHRTVPTWELLRRVHQDGDADALSAWHDFERASKGKKAQTWSKGLRQRLGLDQVLTDEEIVAQVVGDERDARVHLEDWSWVHRAPADGGRLLTTVKTTGWAGVRAFCDERSIPYREVALP